jgi:hypothetical protein
VNYEQVKATEMVAKPLWWQKQGLWYPGTLKIPTSFMVRLEGYDKRWHRVYCDRIGNDPSGYVMLGGERLYLSSDSVNVVTRNMR